MRIALLLLLGFVLAGCHARVPDAKPAPTQVPVAVAPVDPPAPPRYYVVKKGDTLWSVSPGVLGDSFLWPVLYRQNRDDLMFGPNWIDVGQRLQVLPYSSDQGEKARQDAMGWPPFHRHPRADQ